jgi:hypothetical protein
MMKPIMRTKFDIYVIIERGENIRQKTSWDRLNSGFE